VSTRPVGRRLLGALALIAFALGLVDLFVVELGPLHDPVTTALWGVVVWLAPWLGRVTGVRDGD
jgi:hypothetical protein